MSDVVPRAASAAPRGDGRRMAMSRAPGPSLPALPAAPGGSTAEPGSGSGSGSGTGTKRGVWCHGDICHLTGLGWGRKDKGVRRIPFRARLASTACTASQSPQTPGRGPLRGSRPGRCLCPSERLTLSGRQRPGEQRWSQEERR